MARRAKKKPEGRKNKAAAIREFKEKNPDAKPKLITEALNKKGYDVNPQYVSMILSVDRKRNGTSTPRTTVATAGSNTEFTLDQLRVAKQFISQMGGINRAQAVVGAMAELSSND